MALGDGGSNNFSSNNKNNGGDGNYDPTVYSPIKFKNPAASTDPSELSFAFWKNMLKIQISPKVESKTGDYDTYDHTNNTQLMLTPVKAKIFHDEIKLMLEDDSINSVGQNSGPAGLITFSNGKEFGVDGYMLVIRKLDEGGAVMSSYSYQFNNTGFHKSIRDFDETSLKFKTVPYLMVEVEMFLTILEQYYLSQSYAFAYSVVNSVKYAEARTTTKIELVMDKLGIPKQTSGNNARTQSSSFFNNAAKEGKANNAKDDAGYTKPGKQTTLDALADELQ